MTVQRVPQLYYTTREAAAMLGCTTQHIRDLIEAGKLRANRDLGRKILIPADSLRQHGTLPAEEALSSGADNRDVIREMRRLYAEMGMLLAQLDA